MACDAPVPGAGDGIPAHVVPVRLELEDCRGRKHMEVTNVPDGHGIDKILIGLGRDEEAQLVSYGLSVMALEKRREFVFRVELKGQLQKALRERQSPAFPDRLHLVLGRIIFKAGKKPELVFDYGTADVDVGVDQSRDRALRKQRPIWVIFVDALVLALPAHPLIEDLSIPAENVFPPDLVMMLATAPVKFPYSAGAPSPMIWASSITL